MPTGTPNPQTSTPADDPWGETAALAATAPGASPWGETDVPAVGVPGVRPSRWHADESTRAEAARFAVWGERASNDFGAGPPSFATV